MSEGAVQIKGIVEYELRDKDGTLIKKHSQPMRSFVKNFLVFLANLFKTPVKTSTQAGYSMNPYYATLPLSVKDTTGVDKTLRIFTTTSYDVAILGVNAPAGDDSYGIVIGGGSTPPDPEDYMLINQYKEGSDDNQFNYGASTVGDPIVDGNKVTVTITRTFANNSSSGINVNEVGLIAYYYSQAGSSNNSEAKFLIARDVFSMPVTVNSGQVLTVRYVITITT